MATIGSRTGTELAGYRIESVLGRGGMGVVYLAEDVRLQRKVALKLISPELADHPRFRERFLSESLQAASIDHPNIIPIYDAGEADGVLYIAMRYVEGTDLATLIRTRGKLEPAEAVAIASQVANALDCAHDHGLIHRDVKPGNVLLAVDSGRPESRHVYLCDFGLSKSGGSGQGASSTGQLLGTVDYIAPEVIQGAPADARSDLYSLACLLFECLTGSCPFSRNNEIATLWAHVQVPPPPLAASLPDAPERLSRAVSRGLSKAPDQRQASCGRLAEEAAEAIRPPDVVAAPRSTRRASWILPAIAAVALAATLIVVWLSTRNQATTATPPANPPHVPPITAHGVAVYDAASGKFVSMVDTGGTPTQVVSGGGAVWVADVATPRLIRIDPLTASTRTIPLPGTATALTYGGGRVWALLGESRQVVAIDPATGVAGNPRTVPHLCCSGPGAIAADSRHVWVAVEDTTTPFDIATGRSAPPVGDTGSAAIIATPGENGKTVLWSTDGWQTFFRRNEGAVRTQRHGVTDSGTEGRPGAIVAYRGSAWFVASALDAVWRRSLVDGGGKETYQHIDNPTAIAAGAGHVWVLSSSTGVITRLDPNRVTAEPFATLPVHTSGLAVSNGKVWVSTQPAAAADGGTTDLAYAAGGTLKVGQATLTGGKAADSPSWSPDGSRIAFQRVGRIWTMASQGSLAHPVTSGPGDATPAWSPDGRWIAFSSTRQGDSEIYVVHPDGSGVHAVTANDARDLAPHWSPDEATLAYVSDLASPGQLELWTVHDAGFGGVGARAQDSIQAGGPIWSPDGMEVAFWSDEQGSGIYLLRLHGGVLTKLASLPGTAPEASRVSLSWSADGRTITIASRGRLYVVYADGSGIGPIKGLKDVTAAAYRPTISS